VAESRFLQSFCAVAASSVLVSGTLFLLTTTAPWTPPQTNAEFRTPEATPVSIMTKRSGAGDHSPLASDQTELGPQMEAADRTLTASTEKEPDLAREFEGEVAVSDSETVALGMPLSAETADGGKELIVAVPETTQIAAQPEAVVEGPSAGEMSLAASAQSAQAMTALLPRVITAEKSSAATAASAQVMSSLPRRVIASERSGAATAELAEQVASLPPSIITGELSDAATDEIAEVLAGMPPAPPPPPTIKVAALAANTSPAPAVSDKIEIASLKVAAPMAKTPMAAPGVAVAAVVTPPPPLPRRRPEAPPDPQVVAAPAPPPAPVPAPTPPRDKPIKSARAEAPKQAIAQQDAAPAGASAGPWKPMTLAPADKPSVSLSKPPTARPKSGAYASQVWSRLARHKPRAGQRGSASVAFTIGEMGALRTVRIARSSGNARIDQLALATVRNAAPFPAPPSGAVSYTIRIDFQ
jgi:protein TonB